MKTTKKQQLLKITVMKKSEFLLSDLRKVINSDSAQLIEICKNIPYHEDNVEAKRMLLNFIDGLHSRWNDLWELENGKLK